MEDYSHTNAPAYSSFYSTNLINFTMRDLQHKILLILVAITIIAEVASIIFWIVNPTIPLGKARVTLAVDFRIAVANAVVFVALNLVAFLWIVRRNKTGPLFLIAISIINRVISDPIFIGGAHIVFITWTVLLVIFAYLDYRKISKQK
jgi:hypothetical protein